LHPLTLVNPASKIVLAEYLMAVDSGMARVERVERWEGHMEELLEGWEEKRMSRTQPHSRARAFPPRRRVANPSYGLLSRAIRRCGVTQRWVGGRP